MVIDNEKKNLEEDIYSVDNNNKERINNGPNNFQNLEINNININQNIEDYSRINYFKNNGITSTNEIITKKKKDIINL